MGTSFSTSILSASAQKTALKHANSNSDGDNSTSVVIYFWTNPKTGFMPIDDQWPIIKYASKTYIGDLGFAGLISYPWVINMITSVFKTMPTYVGGVTYYSPTLELKKYADDNNYKCTFTTLTSTRSKKGHIVLAVLQTQYF